MKTLQNLETDNNLNKNEMLQVKGGDDVTNPKTNPDNEPDDDAPIIWP